MKLKVFVLAALSALVSFGGFAATAERRMSVAEFRDRMAGAWLGQSVGVAYGAPTEFRHVERTVPDDLMPVWKPEQVNNTFEQDDLYVEMTFLRTLETRGLDVGCREAGIDFANSTYMLWCANGNARDLIRRGVAAPSSSHPKNHPTPDDIDYQIEADFSGIIAPGLPGRAVRFGEQFGRIMNYGDGLYAGQFIGAMYAAAYFERDRVKTVEAGLKCIPAESKYAQMVRDMLAWYREDPKDWKAAWQKAVDKYGRKKSAMAGKVSSHRLDVKINGAMVLLGYLWGDGDILRTAEISTRGGYDSDCNPSSAVGVLGVQLGERAFPDEFKKGLSKTTKWSFTEYDWPGLLAVSEKLARRVVVAEGGRVEGEGADEAFVIPERPVVVSQAVDSLHPGPGGDERLTEAEMRQILYRPCVKGGVRSEPRAGGIPFRLYNVFTSHMVVQRDRPVRVSGTAPAGTEVICGWWPEKSITVTADAQGEWVVEFPARHRGGGSMTFGYKPWSGPQITLEDVVAGEVWLATGQSNMAFPVRALPEREALIASLAKENDIRFLNAPHCSDNAGLWRDFAGTPAWTKASDGRALREASAVGVYFALALKRELAARNDWAPIGILMSNWGGTTIERWEVGTGDLWKAMLAPATEMNVRGAIWYQGCSNAAYPDAYRPKLHRLIDDWRAAWRDPQFAFVLAELASYFQDRPKDPLPADRYMEFGPDQAWNTIGYSPFRQMQTEFLDRKGVGCSLTFDVGEQSNLHPTNKVSVGERMCREALRVAYGDKTILPAPRFDAVRREGDALVVSFKDVGEGLEAVGGKFAPHLWAVKGETADWTWAEAELRADNTVRVSAKGVEKPTGVQFAYMCYHGNVNFRRKGDGLPVFSFRRTLPTAVREEVPLFDGTDVRRWYSFVQAVGKTNVVEGLVRDGCLAFTDRDSLSLTTVNEFSDYRLGFKFRPEATGTNVAVVVHSFGNKGMVGNCAMEGVRLLLAGASAGSWHDAEVVCRGRTVDFLLDGKLVERRLNVNPTSGAIQFVGQASSVSFKDIALKPL